MKYGILGAFLFASLALCAQSSTLFREDFATDIAGQMLAAPSGDDQYWVNFDEDGLPPIDPNLPGGWYWEILPVAGSSSGLDTVIASSSFLVGEKPGNRNWLILPPIQVPDSTTKLRWRSMPLQGPAYHDGYKTLVSTASNNEYDFIDTVFEQAQWLSALDACSVDLADHAFSKGHVHADSFSMLDLFVEVADPASGCKSYLSKLEQHERSLAAFAGQTIYIAFLHDSDNDNLLALDDIEVVSGKTAPVSTAIFEKTLEIWPNPTAGPIILMAEGRSSADVQLRDVRGSTVFEKKAVFENGRALLDLSGLPAGPYFLSIRVDGTIFSKTVFKN